MAAVIEQHYDDKGIIWPVAIAPFHIHLVSLGGADNPAVLEKADALYQELQAKGYEVLYDDRDETAGVKFNDADLIGLPLRLTVSTRNLRDGVVEAKCRWSDDRQVIPFADLYKKIDSLLGTDPAAQ
jgi:prolyl-tRNA synthetase